MKVGFIGLGNMGYALAKGFAQRVNGVEIAYFDPNVHCEDFRKFAKLKALVEWAGVIFLAVKPAKCEQVCKEIAPLLQTGTGGHILVSIAAGVDGKRLEGWLADKRPFLRYVVAMPNTPMLVAEGVCCYYSVESEELLSSELESVVALFASLGLAYRVSPEQMDAVPAMCGSAPAYVYELIRAMGQAGIVQGFSAADAYRLAAQTVLGAAKMVLESSEHPDVLQDRVCSPGGSTIEAVLRLQKEGFATAVQMAMQDCTDKIKKMKKD